MAQTAGNFAAGLRDASAKSAWIATLRLYWEVARRGYRRFATYRGATFAGVFTNTVFGFMRAYVLIAFFQSRGHAGGYSLADALTYTWLTQAALMTVYIWGWYEVAERIRSGDIVSDLQRPADLQLYWLAQDLGRALYHAIFRGIPPFVIGLFAFHLFLPSQPLTYLLFAVSMTIGVCVSFAMRFITNILAFWLLDYRGVTTLAAVLWTFLSGFTVPVAFFPGVTRAVAEALPFVGMVQVPVDIFLERYQGWSLAAVLLRQALWAIVLLLFGRYLLRLAVRRMVIQGG